MYKIAFVVTLCLALGSCASNKAMKEFRTITKIEVIEPPKSLYNCPQIKTIPDPETLTNQEVADFISLLYQHNKTCGISLDKIEAFVERAKVLNK
jgi:hypothetical protein